MDQARYRTIRRATWISLCVNAMLGIAKIGIGVLYGLHVLIADGIHSCSDLAIDVLIVFAGYYASQKADVRHPYGHGRIETAATMALATLISLVGGGMLWMGVQRFWTGHIVYHMHPYTFGIALLSIIANEGLYQYMRKVSKRIDSDLLLASAWHNRSDAGSSVVVLLALLGMQMGWIYMDAIATIAVSAIVIRMGARLGWSSICELIDTAVDAETLARVESVIRQTAGVRALHQLRTRLMGKRILVDVHLLVDPYISVSEGHHIASQVHLAINQQIGNILDVTTHIDSEDDEHATGTKHLPARHVLWPQLKVCWKDLPEFKHIVRYQLHYINRTLSIELWITCHKPYTAEKLLALEAQYKKACEGLKPIKQVRILLTCS